MTITVEAVYENGILKPAEPLPLVNHQKVKITIQSHSDWVQETAGMFGWKGDAELAERFATDPELAFPPAADEP
jgi:predicted DNA-binding antitoxin AbrB/MazE fold protein